MVSERNRRVEPLPLFVTPRELRRTIESRIRGGAEAFGKLSGDHRRIRIVFMLDVRKDIESPSGPGSDSPLPLLPETRIVVRPTQPNAGKRRRHFKGSRVIVRVMDAKRGAVFPKGLIRIPMRPGLMSEFQG